jgi:isoquinoline 1-oxidoreductase beta subunit
MDRREFLKASAAGAGLVLGFYINPRGVLAQFQMETPGNMPPNAFVRISPDNIITVISKHTEMGQGVYTGLATLLAEELDADWSQVRVASAPVDLKFYRHLMLGMQGTGGSSSMRNSWLQYRTVGATARAMLVSAAARDWNVPETEITVSKGIVSHPSGQRATFGELSEKAAAITPPAEVKLKDRKDYTLIGTDLPKVDTRDKSDGTARYTIDVQRPGMLTAVVARAPRFGGKLKSFDDSATRKIKGVVDVVAIPRGVAVLAANTWTAMRGRDALKLEWDESAAEMRGSEDIIRDFFRMAEQPGAPYEMKGDVDGALAAATKTFKADYVFPYLAHATMEPVDCSIEMTGDKCLIRSGTQMPSIERDWVAELLGLAPENVQVENLYAGGGFGRRGNFVPDLASETASIVKATGGKYPIKLQYTREDDMRAGFYRPLFVHRLRGALDAQGNISAWSNRVVGQSFVEGTFFGGMIRNGIDPIAVEGSAHLPYAIPNVAVDFHLAHTGVPTLAWRSVGHTHTAYSKETFLDELLHAAGRDPVAGRLALMADERSKAVLRLAAEKAGWDNAPAKGRARGAAFVESFGSRVAQIAEVSKDGQGRVRVEKVVCAVDCGTAINPNIVRDQIESAIGFGLTAALYGEIVIEGGIVRTGNFDTYPLLRIHEMPVVEVHIVPSTADPTGIGEPGTPPIAPAVANAWYRLTGERVRRLPFNRA